MARRQKCITEEQVARLIAVTQGERYHRRDRALLELLYGAGLRVTEALALDVADCDLEVGEVHVWGKGGKVRTVPLGTQAVRALRAHLRRPRRSRGPLFTSNRRTRMNARLAQRIVEKYSQKAGLPHLSPHSLRHSMASHLLARGAYLWSVSELLGHRLVRSTAIYLHEVRERPEAAEEYRRCHPRA